MALGQPSFEPSMNNFSVRVRIRIPPGERIGIADSERRYSIDLGEVVLRAANVSESIEVSEWLLISCKDLESEVEAEEAAVRLLDALRLTLSRFGMAADLGRRVGRSFMFRPGLAMVEQQAGRPALNDVHGGMVYPTELAPAFVRVGDVQTIRTIQADRWDKALGFALSSGRCLTERTRVAFDLYASSFWSQHSAEARFALLFAAFEALLEHTPRPRPVVEHVDRLIQFTRDAGLDPRDTDSLVGSLMWLRSHSIRTAGRQLVQRLGERDYDGQSPQILFDACYVLRNRLLHGTPPLPTREEVGTLAVGLQLMVGHLIAIDLLNLDV